MKMAANFLLAVLCGFIFSVIFGCGNNDRNKFDISQGNQVIYGEDNRKDFNEVNDPELLEMAHSTVALIDKSLMTLDTVFNVYRLEKSSSSMKLCSSERFRLQSTWSHCSGSLIGEDVVLTAGHCVVDEKDCRSAYYVFDYKLLGKDNVFSQVSANSVYTCAGVIYSNGENRNLPDFALIRLDRKVLDRKPLALSEKEVAMEDNLMMIGHPSGYPTKFTFDGRVRNISHQNYITIAIDAYTGNSGSSVFDQSTHKIVGVLSRGEKDFVSNNSCLVSNVCDEVSGCRGEDVTRIEQVKKYLPKDMQPNPSEIEKN